MNEELIKEAEAIIESIDIPSQPQVLLNIYNEVLKPEPDFRTIKEYVSQDIAMAAKIIKIANSAFFGLRYKVHSIEHALTILGLENFTNIVGTSAFKDALISSRVSENEFEDFFNHSIRIARISQFITHKAQIFSGGIVFPSHTYMAGLFHDCGILILSKKFQNYFNTVRSSLQEDQSLLDFEESHYKTNHCILGYVVAKLWQLPDIVCEIIQHHHNPDIDIHCDSTVKKILAINILAEAIITYNFKSENSGEKIYGIKINSKEDLKKIFNELNLDENDFRDILATAKDVIGLK